MKNNVLQAILGIEVFPVISLIIFVVVFTTIIIWVLKLDKQRSQRMAELPLNDGNREDIFNKNL